MASALTESFLDLLSSLGGVSARRMFGGQGFYKDGLMFAIEANERLYMKMDEETRPDFEKAGCEPFMLHRKSQVVITSYQAPPESALANPQRMKPWALMGFQAAQRKAQADMATKAKTKKQPREKAKTLKTQPSKPRR